jgi:hypothetical protein
MTEFCIFKGQDGACALLCIPQRADGLSQHLTCVRAAVIAPHNTFLILQVSWFRKSIAAALLQFLGFKLLNLPKEASAEEVAGLFCVAAQLMKVRILQDLKLYTMT